MITQARLDEIHEAYTSVNDALPPRGMHSSLVPAVKDLLRTIPELLDAVRDSYVPQHRDVLLCVSNEAFHRYVYVAQYYDLGDGMSPYWQIAGSDMQYSDDEILPYAVELLHREEQPS